MAQSKTTISDNLFDKVSNSLKNKENLSLYSETIAKYLAANHESYYGEGPSTRPIYPTAYIDKYINMVGLKSNEIDSVLKSSKNVKSSWFMLKPYNIANALATRYFLLTKNIDYIRYTTWYLIVELYPPLHYRYFKYNINEACMQYTINNLSGKFNIKSADSLFSLLSDTCMKAVDLHEDKLKEGTDIAFVNYLQDIQSRLNSLLKNIANVYYDNYENRRFLSTERESFDEDNYHEADSNSYAIENITNKVVSHLVVHGPDLKIVQLAAKTNNVSVNEMRNYADAMITDDHRSDIKQIVESILFLYLFNEEPGEIHSPDSIGTNEFMLHCLKIYKKSNTTNKNILKIKDILNKWLDDVGLSSKTSRPATIGSFKKAFYTFFVMEIQKISSSR